MDGEKIRRFMELAGQYRAKDFETGDEARRKLGAQLLLSETLEYVIKGLGIHPVVDGTPITEWDSLDFESNGKSPDQVEMLDGLADVAYTMYWNAVAFGIPLEEGFELVCDNNLEKFVRLDNWSGPMGPLDKSLWDCERGVTWPKEVVDVRTLRVDGIVYAVGHDERGKVRKPSTYTSVDLEPLVGNT